MRGRPAQCTGLVDSADTDAIIRTHSFDEAAEQIVFSVCKRHMKILLLTCILAYLQAISSVRDPRKME